MYYGPQICSDCRRSFYEIKIQLMTILQASGEPFKKVARQWWHLVFFHPMIGENRQLVTNEPVEFEKEAVEVQVCRKITGCFRGIYRIHPDLIKENRRMSTRNRSDLQTLGSQPVMPKNLPDYCMLPSDLWTEENSITQEQRTFPCWYSSLMISCAAATKAAVVYRRLFEVLTLLHSFIRSFVHAEIIFPPKPGFERGKLI